MTRDKAATSSKTAGLGDTPARRVRDHDYYIEGGLLVFTAAYHLRRGYCCGSGCRHCPYKPDEPPAKVDPLPR